MIDVWPATDLPPGKIAGSVVVSGIAVDGEELPDLIVPIRGAVLPEFEVLPQTVTLGSPAVGSEARETITVRSRLGLPFRIVELRPRSDDIRWLSGAEAAGSAPSAQIELTVRVTEPGSQSLALRLVLASDEDTQREETILPLEVRYRGMAQPPPQ
jgi:hypothetical protein